MLGSGHQLAQYRVVSLLGSGGMGEVYLAEDTRLLRKVALKILPPSSADERSRKRLLREAQVAATLDHPNICTVYDVGEADGIGFIAMQYIEGQTLAERLARGPLDRPSALAIAAQVAAALAAAHRGGILHRDIKPQNIMLTAGNQVKVLDFGLANAATTEANAHTATLLTAEGVVAGTAPYMSPEQVRGEPLDARSDIFSVGCVLYELFGRVSPFLCEHPAQSMSAVLSHEPAPLPDTLASPELQRIVRKCLEKDRERRYQTMSDLAIDLETVARDMTSRPSSADHRSAGRADRGRLIMFAVAGAALLAAAAAGAYVYMRPNRPFHPAPADFVQITSLPDFASAPALSPDGRMIAFIRGDDFLDGADIYVKLLPDGDPVQLTHDPRPKYALTFTPDGSRVAFTMIDQVGTPGMSWDTWTAPVTGGQPSRLLPNAAGLTWIDDRHVLFSEIEPGTGLHMGVVTAGEDRRDERRVYFPSETRAMAHYSYLSPDRRSVLVVEMDRTGTFEPCRLVPFDGSSAGRVVGPAGHCTAAAWSPDGAWMYFSANVKGSQHIWRQRVNGGSPEQVTFGPTQERGIAMATDGGSLITSIGQAHGSLWIHDDRGERMLPLDGSAVRPHMSRDGAHIDCLMPRRDDASTSTLTVVDAESGRTDRLFTEFSVLDFDISPDERLIAFAALGDHGRHELWVAPLDHHLPPRRLTGDADSPRFARNGDVVYRSLTGTSNALMRIGPDGGHTTRIFDRPIIDIGAVSPDGTWTIVSTPAPEKPSALETVAVPVYGGAAARLCAGDCPVLWSLDGSAGFLQSEDSPGHLQLISFTVRQGDPLPHLADGRIGVESLIPNSSASWGDVAIGLTGSVYAISKGEQRSNLFRVPLR